MSGRKGHVAATILCHMAGATTWRPPSYASEGKEFFGDTGSGKLKLTLDGAEQSGEIGIGEDFRAV